MRAVFHKMSVPAVGKTYKEYIRGVIIGKALYLRAYYPYNSEDISGFSLSELYTKSKRILNLYIKELLKEIENNYKINIKEIVYNADKDLKINNIC